ncbi:MAG: hypothetical protein JMN25_18115 [gamma proteobacterium endosymbiont of Lamellibrachia anaximandri]|nr:hypothetical protein [gamma proteobacterium endosymbiont of Lamellibrachia anaximandri]
MDWAVLAAIAVPVGTFLFALYRWMVTSEDQRQKGRDKRWKEHQEQEEAWHKQHEKRWEEHSATFLRHEERIEKNETDLSLTRDELHRDYVREDQMKEFRAELRDDIGKIFQKLNGMSRDLNQVIGEIKAGHGK